MKKSQELFKQAKIEEFKEFLNDNIAITITITENHDGGGRETGDLTLIARNDRGVQVLVNVEKLDVPEFRNKMQNILTFSRPVKRADFGTLLARNTNADSSATLDLVK